MHKVCLELGSFVSLKDGFMWAIRLMGRVIAEGVTDGNGWKLGCFINVVVMRLGY